MASTPIAAGPSSGSGYLNLQACRMKDEKSFDEFGTGLLFYVPDERLSFYCFSGKIWGKSDFTLRASFETDPSFTLSSYGDEITDHKIPCELVEKIKGVAQRLFEHRKIYPRKRFSFIDTRKKHLTNTVELFDKSLHFFLKEFCKAMASGKPTASGDKDESESSDDQAPPTPEKASYLTIGCDEVGTEVSNYLDGLGLNLHHDLEKDILNRSDQEVIKNLDPELVKRVGRLFMIMKNT